MSYPIRTSRRVRFLDWDCRVWIAKYANRRPAVILTLKEDTDLAEPVTVATVNLVNHTPAPRCVFLKTWGENEGIYEALRAANLVGPIKGHVTTGHVLAPECELLLPEAWLKDSNVDSA